LEDLIERLSQHSPRLEDLSPRQLEDLGRLVIVTKLGDDLRRRVALSRIDCAAELKTFLAVASPSGSWATAQAYARGLDRLDRWVFRRGLDLLGLTPHQADDYIYALRLEGRCPGSIRLDVAGPSAFFSYLERRYDVVSNPFRGTRARPAYRPHRPLAIPSTAEVDVLVRTARPDLRAAILCLSQRGLRVGALPDLVLKGHDFSGWSKGTPVSGQMPEAVVEAIRAAGLPASRPFRGLTAHQLGDRIRGHGQRLAAQGLVATVYSAHDYRHYFAVQDYRIHKDIYRLKQLLGHSDLRNTERYLRSLNLILEG